MKIRNTEELKRYIIGQEISEEEEKKIEFLIKAFSEYIVATNPDFYYNKTYLRTYVDDFFRCVKKLKEKYKILTEEILPILLKYKAEENCIIRVDRTWIYATNKISLCNQFDKNIVGQNSIRLEMEYKDENEIGFVIVEEIDMKENYSDVIKKCICDFLNRRKELGGNEA